MFSCCHQPLLSIKLVFHQAGCAGVLETTDKEVGPLPLKSNYAAVVFGSLSFLYSKYLQSPASASPSVCVLASSALPEYVDKERLLSTSAVTSPRSV